MRPALCIGTILIMSVAERLYSNNNNNIICGILSKSLLRERIKHTPNIIYAIHAFTHVNYTRYVILYYTCKRFYN